MRTAVVGAGPVGMFTALALARRGDGVVLVDRDGGPDPDGTWQRRGVMQFRHPHFFRNLVRQALIEHVPDAWEAILGAGGLQALGDGMPEQMAGLSCRRAVVERVLRGVVRREPGVTMLTGHADRPLLSGDRIRGVLVDGRAVEADRVVVATGRTGRFADELRAPGEGGPCGFAYVSRMYRARDGVELPDNPFPTGWLHRGYLALLFPQDDRTLSALVVRDAEDAGMAGLRHAEVFDAVARRIPQLEPWTDPDRFQAITPVLPGGGLTNTYRGQLDEDGRVPVAGLFFVGDAVCTTNPAAGRGVSLGLRQATQLVRLLEDSGTDPRVAAEAFDSWCSTQIRPWFEDHVYWDTTLRRRFAGEDLDVEARIPSDVICAAADVDPAIQSAVRPFLGMLEAPSILRTVEERARAVLRTGWRPPYAPGPSRDELLEAVPVAA